MHPRLLVLAFPIILIGAWELSADLSSMPRYLPAPSVIGQRLFAMLVSGELLEHSGISLFRALSGYFIGSAFGVLAGLLAGRIRQVEAFYDPIISLTYPVPKIALLPIIFAWFGLGDVSKIIIISISVFFPVYVSAFYGAKAALKTHIWAARNMGVNRRQLFFKVVLPSALPQIFNGLRVGLALSFIVMFVGEMIFSRAGLGYLITFAGEGLRFDVMFAAIVTIGLIGFVFDRALLRIQARALRGREAIS